MRQATCANLQGRKPSSHYRLWDALNRSHGKSIEFAYYLVARRVAREVPCATERLPSFLPACLPVETASRTGYPGPAGYWNLLPIVSAVLGCCRGCVRRRFVRKSRAFVYPRFAAFVPLAPREASRFRYISLDGDSRCDLACYISYRERKRRREANAARRVPGSLILFRRPAREKDKSKPWLYRDTTFLGCKLRLAPKYRERFLSAAAAAALPAKEVYTVMPNNNHLARVMYFRRRPRDCMPSYGQFR